jgi:ABC-type phosphate transport system substrate-binding protein
MKKLFLFAFVFIASLLSARAQVAALIANPAVTESKLTAEDAKNILLGTKTKWDNGSVIRVIVLSTGAVHEQVIKEYTQRTPDQFDKFWKKQVFTGKGIMPQIAKSETEMLDLVAKTPGAFGYVSKDAVPAGVKNLTP